MKNSLMKSCVSIFSILFVLITVAPATHAATGEAQVERFEFWLRELKKVMTMSPDAGVVAKELVDGEARNITFHLQGLGRIYQFQDPKFASLVLKDMKDLEDAIGQYDMWKTLDEAKARKAEKVLVDMLQKEGWSKNGQSSHIDEISTFLKGYNWLNYSADRSTVLRVVQQQLQTLARTEYDLTRLEKKDGDGNGLHELRRELRWFLIEVKALNGLLKYDPAGACGVTQYAPLLQTNLVTHKYAKLNEGVYETQPCYIEQCSVLGVVRSVNVLGGIKDAGEEDRVSREADRVPADRIGEATELYRQIQETQVFSRLSDQIGRCLQ